MREEKIGEGEGNLSKERFPSPSPNLSPSSPKTFDLIESPLPVFPVKTKPERNPFRLCSAAPGNLHQGWASAPPRPLPAPFMKVLGGEGWGLVKGGEALLQKGSPPATPFPSPSGSLPPIFYSFPSPFPNFLTMALAGMMPVAAADTMLPDTPGPSPATKRLETDVSRSLDVATCVEKNLISGA